MAFLDNSGDIILDAVITDTGRKRMAEGTFRITKFALGDDEIDYSLYNSSDSRGSAYYDLDILSTPVLEAFTDNASAIKSRLLSIPRTDLLYLPVVKIWSNGASVTNSTGGFTVALDSDTYNALGSSTTGVMSPQGGGVGKFIELHQGIDNEQKPHTQALDGELIESQYIIEIDDRLGKVANTVNGAIQQVSYVDDDNIASYFFVLNQSNLVQTLDLTEEDEYSSSSIVGSRGTKLMFKIIPNSTTLGANNFLWLRLGGEVTINSAVFYYIDDIVRVIGATTGYRIDIPVRFLKKKPA